jgi:hypothetical protein
VPKFPCDRTVAVTAIEHHNIVITVVSLLREFEASALSTTQIAFVTTILGGPLWQPYCLNAAVKTSVAQGLKASAADPRGLAAAVIRRVCLSLRSSKEVDIDPEIQVGAGGGKWRTNLNLRRFIGSIAPLL